MGISTTGGRVYLLELQPPFERLEFQFLPNDLYWERIGNWVNVPITGRNNSRKHLTGGEDKLTFQLDFNALFEENKKLCINRLSWLQSLTVNDGYSGPSRNVKLIWGESDLFRHKVWIMKRVGGRMSLFHGGYNMDPMQLILDVEMELDPEENTRLRDVRLFDIENNVPSVRGLSDYLSPGPIA